VAGADVLINYHDVDELSGGIRNAAGKDKWPLIIESSGNTNALKAAMALGAVDARILILGDYSSGQADFKWNQLLLGELHLTGSNTGSGAWAEAGRMSTEMNFTSLVTHRFPAADFENAIKAVQDRTSGAVKVVLEWE